MNITSLFIIFMTASAVILRVATAMGRPVKFYTAANIYLLPVSACKSEPLKSIKIVLKRAEIVS